MAATRKPASTDPIETTATEVPYFYKADRHETVAEAIAAVTRELGPIAKLTSAERKRMGLSGGDGEGVSYPYRGIEEITAALQPLMGKHELTIVPSRMDLIFKGEVEKGKFKSIWVHIIMGVEWTIIHPSGQVTAYSIGEGQDNGDKTINKCRTVAFKNLLLSLFMVADPKDDTDGHTVPETSPRGAPVHHDEPAEEEAPVDPKVEFLGQLKAEQDARGLSNKDVGDVMVTTGHAARDPRSATIPQLKAAINLVRMMDPDAIESPEIPS